MSRDRGISREQAPILRCFGDRRQMPFAEGVDEQELRALPVQALAGRADRLSPAIDRFVADETGSPPALRLKHAHEISSRSSASTDRTASAICPAIARRQTYGPGRRSGSSRRAPDRRASDGRPCAPSTPRRRVRYCPPGVESKVAQYLKKICRAPSPSKASAAAVTCATASAAGMTRVFSATTCAS